MTYYDDCLYCSTCGWHHEECWCRGGVLRDPDEQVCHRPNPDEGSIGYGRAEQPCTLKGDRPGRPEPSAAGEAHGAAALAVAGIPGGQHDPARPHGSPATRPTTTTAQISRRRPGHPDPNRRRSRGSSPEFPAPV